MMGFLVSADAEHEDLERYFRALRRAQAELDLEPDPYKRHTSILTPVSTAMFM